MTSLCNPYLVHRFAVQRTRRQAGGAATEQHVASYE